MFLTKQDFQKNVSRHDGKSKIVVKFHGVPIYTFCQDISFRESMMLAETIVSEILDGKNKTALMRINDILDFYSGHLYTAARQEHAHTKNERKYDMFFHRTS